MNVVVWFAFSFVFILGLQNDFHRIVLTTFRANNLTSINIILKVLHRQTQRFFFYNFVLYIIFSFSEIAIPSFFPSVSSLKYLLSIFLNIPIALSHIHRLFFFSCCYIYTYMCIYVYSYIRKHSLLNLHNVIGSWR